MVAAKKKKPPAHSDFTKSKSSLKAKQRAVPSNATNTSFKARSIVLPNQSTITDIQERRATKLTDDKGRGVAELVTILRGVGQGGASKSEALDSLGALLPRLPDSTTTTLGLLPIVLPLITSSAEHTRKSLHRFVVTALQALPRDALAPYATTMTLWLTSGMNHIWKEVREDAARLAEAVLDFVGLDMVRGWQLGATSAQDATTTTSHRAEDANTNNGQRLFSSLLTSLGVSHYGAGPSSSSSSSSTPSVNIQSDLSSSPLSKMRLMRCLDKLVRCQSGLVAGSSSEETQGPHHRRAAATTSEFPLWIFRSCFTSSADWEAFVSVTGHGAKTAESQGNSEFVPFAAGYALVEHSMAAASAPLCDVDASAGRGLSDGELLAAASAVANLSGSSGSAPSVSSSSSNPYLALYASLHPLLLSTFLDHAPATLGPDASSRGGSEVPLGLKLIDAVLSLARTLGRAALRSSSTHSGPATISSGDRAAIANLWSLLDRAAIYFPFEQRASALIDERTALLRRMSAAWCELVGACRMVTEPMDSARPAVVAAAAKGKKKRANAASAAAHLSSVEEYLVSLLAQPSSSGADLSTIGAPSTQQGRLSEEEYLALLPTVWHLVCHARDESDEVEDAMPSSSSAASLLSTLISHWSQSSGPGSSSTGLHSLGLRFLLCICLVASQPSCSLAPSLRTLLARPRSDVRVALRDGFLAPGRGGGGGLGRALYEVAAKAGREAELLGSIRCLLEVVRSHSPLLDAGGTGTIAGAGQDVESRLAASLCPLFWVPAVIKKGGVVARKETPGPYVRAVQRMPPAARGEMDAVARALAEYLDDESLSGAMRKTGVLPQKDHEAMMTT